jgi:hypothetical protein
MREACHAQPRRCYSLPNLVVEPTIERVSQKAHEWFGFHTGLLVVLFSESKALSDAISSTRSLTAMSTVVRYGLIHLEIEGE